jgi:hypothetical protein
MNRIGRQNPILHTGTTTGTTGTTFRRIAVGIAAGALMTGMACAHIREFDVRSGELKPALDAYIAQSGVQLIYKVEDVKDLSTRGVKGKIASDAALDRLLDGTRLRIRRGQDGAMVLIAPASPEAMAVPATTDKRR